MIDIREFTDHCCRYCNGKFEHHPDPNDKTKIQTLTLERANICRCGRSGWARYAYNGNVFHLYFNGQFTIECTIKDGIIKNFLLLKNKDGCYCTDVSTLDINMLYYTDLCEVKSIDQLYLIVDCFIGTLGFQ
jgi:hypothetical protein